MKKNSKLCGGALLDALTVRQREKNFLSLSDIEEIARAFGISTAQVYETASFYSMLRFQPSGKIVIEVCRSAPCHVAGAANTIRALEEHLGISMGESTGDGRFELRFTECIGQCQNGSSVLVNGRLHTCITAERVPELLEQIEKEEM